MTQRGRYSRSFLEILYHSRMPLWYHPVIINNPTKSNILTIKRGVEDLCDTQIDITLYYFLGEGICPACRLKSSERLLLASATDLGIYMGRNIRIANL